jgi:foldase protein PrsA
LALFSSTEFKRRLMMRYIFPIFGALVIPILIIVSAASAAGQKAPSSPESPALAKDNPKGREVAARVNGVEISNESVEKMIGVVRKEQGGVPKSDDELRKAALDKIILSELAYQKALREGIKADQSQIDGAVAKLKQKMGGEDGFKQFLQREQITEDQVKKEIERSLTVRSLISSLAKGITVTEDQARQEYGKNKKKFSTPEKVEAIDVIFFLDVNDPGSMRKAEQVLGKINENKEKDPKALTSDGTFVVRDLTVDGKKDNELYMAAKRLVVGEISGVIRAGGNLHILKLTSFTPEVQFSYEQVKGSIMKQLRSEAFQKKMKEWEKELRRDAKIEIVAPGEAPDAANPEAKKRDHEVHEDNEAK